MAARSLAELSISFGLVSIPVRLYTATDGADGVSFNLIHRGCGSRVRQEYICIKENIPVSRTDMDRGFEFEPDRYVIFSPEEMKAVAERGTQLIEIVAFIPEHSVDPIYFDKAYYLGPGRRGEKPFTLLLESMKKAGKVALARWAWRGKAYTVQVRPARGGGLVLQQLFYAAEVRDIAAISFEPAEIKPDEMSLALMLIDRSSREAYDPNEFTDEVKKRIEAAIEEKIHGKQITLAPEPARGGQVIDLMEALRASLNLKKERPQQEIPAAPKTRKPVKRATSTRTPASKKSSGK